MRGSKGKDMEPFHPRTCAGGNGGFGGIRWSLRGHHPALVSLPRRSDTLHALAVDSWLPRALNAPIALRDSARKFGAQRRAESPPLLASALCFNSVLLLQVAGYSFLKPLARGAVAVARDARRLPRLPLQQKPTARR